MKPINQTILRLLAVILMTAGLFGGNNHAYAWGGDGSSNNPYVIQSEKDWKTFCQKTNDGYFRDAYGELGADITVTITSDDNDAMDLMCGRSYYPFIGYFDGRGHTLTFNCEASNEHFTSSFGYAPFSFVAGGATITNLRVAGTINTPKRLAAGFIATCQKDHSSNTSSKVRISNCVSSITINSTYVGDGSHGGFIAYNSSSNISIVIENCLFDGKLLGANTHSCGGFEGAGYSTSINNSLFAPSELSVNTNESSTFTRATKADITNSYYKKTLGTVQGTDATSFSSATLAEKLGEKWMVHNDTVYLTKHAKYLDMTGWVQGGNPSTPVICGGNGGTSNYYFKSKDDNADYFKLYIPADGGAYCPTNPGEYILKLETGNGTGTNGDNWTSWVSCMNFCIVKPPVGVTTSIGYDATPKNLLSNMGDPIVNTCKFYYKVDADGTWSDAMPQAINAGNHTVYYYVKGDATHNDIGSESNPAGQIVVPISRLPVVQPVIEVSSITYTGSPLQPTVVVKAENGTILDSSEYNVTFENNTDAGLGTVKISDKSGGNYWVYNAETTFQILKADPSYTAPTANALTYNGTIQKLITEGSTPHGTMYYGINPDNLSPTATPTGTDAGAYLTYYKVVGDANHNDFGPKSLPVTISPKKVDSPEIILSPDMYYYDGTAKEPVVTVRDNGTVVPTSEYTVIYSNNTNAGTATVTIRDNEGGNYAISGTASFSIIPQATGITPPTPISGLIYNTSLQNLIMVGTAVGGTMEYSLDGTNYSTDIPQGQDAKQYEVYYRVKGDGNHSDSDPVKIFVTINPKTVSSPIISLSSTSLVYDGKEKRPEVTVKDGKTVIPPSEYTVDYSNNINVGTAMVIIMDNSDGNYIVNGTTTFTIIAAGAGITPPTAKTGLIYNGTPQELVTAGSAEGGTIEYSLDRSTYTIEIPTGTDAMDYKVYYRVKGDSNHGDETAASLTVTIGPKPLSEPDIILSPASFVYDGTEKTPSVTVKDGDNVIPSTEYTVSYSDNKSAGTGTVTITDNEGGNYNISGTAQFSIVAAVTGITLPEAKSGLVYNGKAQELITAGSSVGGTMEYSLDNSNYSTKIPTGTDAGQYTVYFKVVGDENHASTDPVSLIVTISSKSLTSPVIILTPSAYIYNGNEKKPMVTVKDGDNVVPSSEYTVSYSNNIEVGTATVTLTDNPGGNYIISATTTFRIYNADASYVAPLAKTGLIYNGLAQELITAGTAVAGVMQYSLDGGDFSVVIPTATDAGTYKVSYRVISNDGSISSKTGDISVVLGPKVVSISIVITNNGPETAPYISVFDEQDNNLPSTGYTVVYRDTSGKEVCPVNGRMEAGSYVVTVTPTGNYNGPSVSTSFNVRKPYSFVFVMTSDLIPLCLPYDKTIPNSYNLYIYDHQDENGKPVFKRYSTNLMKAGEPYLVRYIGAPSSTRGETRAEGGRVLNLTPDNLALVDLSTPLRREIGDDLVFVGTFDDMSNAQVLAEGAYLLQTDDKWSISASRKSGDATETCLKAFYAYIRYQNRTTPVETLGVTVLEPPTAIDAVILENEEGDHMWYDLQGHRLDNPQKGINILRQDNGKTKKVVIK